MKMDPTMLLLIAGGAAAAIYFATRGKGAVTNGLSQSDMAMMQQLTQMQAAAGANQEAMARIISDARKKDPVANPWASPDVLFGLARIGIEIADTFGTPDPVSSWTDPVGGVHYTY